MNPDTRRACPRLDKTVRLSFLGTQYIAVSFIYLLVRHSRSCSILPSIKITYWKPIIHLAIMNNHA